MSQRPRLAAAAVAFFAAFFAGAAPVGAAEAQAPNLFQPDTVAVIDLQLPQASIETLEAEPEDHYVAATFSLAESDGTPGGVSAFTQPRPVGVRLKGNLLGSYRPIKDGKSAFKIKFKEFGGEKFEGLKKLTLNNMVEDRSMLHETLTYEVFRSLGLPAPRTGYAFLTVNGDVFGVYLNVETYDDVSLPSWFASTGHLYEADAAGTDVTAGSAGAFEVDEGDDEDRADLEALIAAAEDGPGDWSDGMGGAADLDQMARMWAVERYAGHWDGYAGRDATLLRPNNYYLHSDEAGLFSMLPWGTDLTWGVHLGFDEQAGGRLFNDCLADGSCAASYVEGLREVKGAVADLDLGAQIDCLAEMLAPWQALEGEERREYSASQIAGGVSQTAEFAELRPSELTSWLKARTGDGSAADVDAERAPCASPEPGEPAAGTPASGVTGPARAPASLRFGRPRMHGAFVETPVFLPEAGLALQRVSVLSGPRRRPACLARRPDARAGRMNLRCKLPRDLRAARSSRPLRLEVKLAFAPGAGGARTTRFRQLALPRLPR